MPKFEDPRIRERQEERMLGHYLGPFELILTDMKGFLDVSNSITRCDTGKIKVRSP